MERPQNALELPSIFWNPPDARQTPSAVCPRILLVCLGSNVVRPKSRSVCAGARETILCALATILCAQKIILCAAGEGFMYVQGTQTSKKIDWGTYFCLQATSQFKYDFAVTLVSFWH